MFAAERTLGYSPDTWLEQGTTFYGLAADHHQAEYHALSATLRAFSENFALAVKPLKLITERYLNFLQENMFGV